MKYLVVSILLASMLVANGFEDLVIWPSSALRTRPMRDTVAIAWVARYDGPDNGYDLARSMAVDTFGNVYITGVSYGGYPGTSDDYATVKYTASGQELWVQRYNGTGSGIDEANDLAIDDSGNVYVTGFSWGGSSYDCVTIRYSTNGELIWSDRYANSHGTAIAVDNEGNIIVTGEGPYYSGDYLTLKYSSSGNLLWSQTYNNGGEDEAVALAIDSQNNIIITGESEEGGDEAYATVKYSPTGQQLWVQRYNGPGGSGDYAYDIAVDLNDNIFVTGSSDFGSPSDYDILTIKYAPDSTQAWARRYNGPGNSSDVPNALAVDANCNVVVTGFSYDLNGFRDYVTIKYDTLGNELWVQRYDAGDWNNLAKDVTIDGAGNVYITGLTLSPATNYDCTTIKYGPDGEEIWVQSYDGPAEEDGGMAIGLTETGDIYVVGYSEGIGTNYDYMTIKYTPDFPSVSVDLLPIISPIIISPFGGSFDYEIFLVNNENISQEVQVWSEMRFPNDSIYSPLQGPITLSLSPGTTARVRTQDVEHEWFSGDFSYKVFLGIYPDIIWSKDSIQFMKRGIEGPISGTWDSLRNPYIFSDSLWVPEGETLTFLPGVDIDCEFSGIKLTAYGRLEVLGAAGAHVDMTSGTGSYLKLGLQGSGPNADLIQHLDINGQINLSGSDHVLSDINLYNSAGEGDAANNPPKGLLGPVSNVTVSGCTLEVYAGNGWPWYAASATGIYQVNGVIENSKITVAAHNSCYENFSSAYAVGIASCAGEISNNVLSVHAHNTMSDWMMSSTAKGINACNGNISKNYVKIDVDGYGKQAYGITDCNASIINNSVFLDGGQTSYGITDSATVLNNIVDNVSWNGVGISGGTTVNFNMIHGFTTMLQNVPANNYHNFPDDPMVNWANGQLLANSPCINRGDPNPIYNDPDGSRNDRGWLAFDPDSGANLIASQNALNFGQIQVGSYLDMTVIFMNTGLTAGEIERYDVSNPMYSVVSGVPSGPIAPGGIAAVVIRFAPTQIGQYIYKEISFSGSIPPYHIVLHGEGTQ